MRTALVYILYWTGDWVSRVMHYFDWSTRILYPVYKTLMLWSADLDRRQVVWKKSR